MVLRRFARTVSGARTFTAAANLPASSIPISAARRSASQARERRRHAEPLHRVLDGADAGLGAGERGERALRETRATLRLVEREAPGPNREAA